MAHKPKQLTEADAPRPVLGHERSWTRKLPRWTQRTIGARLQTSHLLAALLPLLALGFFLLLSSADSERRIVEQTQRSVASSIALDIANTLGQLDSELLSFGRKVRLNPSHLSVAEADTKEYIDRRFPDIVELAILDLSGQELVRVSQQQVYPESELVNRSQEPFFALASQGLIHHSVTLASDSRSVIQIAAPARNGIGQVIGIVVAFVRTQNIEQRLADVPRDTGRSTFIMDEMGNVLLGQPPGTLLGTEDLRNWARNDAPIATLRGTDGRNVTAARAVIKSNPWSLVIEQPTDIAYDSLRRNLLLLGLALVGTTGLVVVWGVVVSREMTRPILQLRDGVQVLASGQLGGVIDVARDDELGHLAHEFNRMSERLAESQRAIELRNAQLSEGLSLARLIQHDLLPQDPPLNAPIIAHAVCEPATEIGGDFYTYIPMPDGRIRLIIGDASGKGVAAALVMAMTSSLVDVHAREAAGPAELLTRLNAELYPRLNPSHTSVSLLVTEFDPHTQHMCVANGGMIAPLVAGANTCFFVACFGPPLGIVEQMTYLETTLRLEPDQAVVFVSDGIVEARNAANEMWGFDRLETSVCRAAGDPSQRIVDYVLAAVREHVGSTAPADDMTIIATTLAQSTEKDASYAWVPFADISVPAK